MADNAPIDRIFRWNAFDLAERILDGASDEPIRPEDFGPYKFLDRPALGSGAISDVWLAIEEGIDRKVAIKFLLRASNPDFWANREMKRQGALQSPNVAHLFNQGVLDGVPWLAMEYVEDGIPLDEYAVRQGASIRERLALFRSVCEGVQYAHSRLIIHGDLKPSNILVNANGTPKILDFGMAEQFQPTDGTLTQSPSALGFTPAYAAPEQFRGEPVSVAIDVYALGVMLYQLLAGRLPFDESQLTYADLKEIKTSDRKPSPPFAVAESKDEISASEQRDLDSLCLMAMEGDPNRRYKTVEALLQDLERFDKQEPLTARAPHPWFYRARKFYARRRLGLLTAAGVIIAIISMAGFFTVRLASERDKARAEAARAQQIQSFMVTIVGAGDEQSAPSKDLTIEQLLERGTKEAGSLSSDPETQVELYQTLGSMYQKLGKFQKADALLRKGLEIAKRLEPNPVTAGIWVQLGVCRGDMADYTEAENLLREGLLRFELSHTHPDHPLLLGAQSSLGRVLIQGGKLEQGIATLQPIIQRKAETDRQITVLLESLTSLGFAHQYLGHYELAETIGRRALELDRKKNGVRHPRVAVDLSAIATSLVPRGRFREAEPLYREAIEIYDSHYAPDHPDTLQLRSFLATALTGQGKLSEAEKLLRDILPLQERAYGTSLHPSVAFTHGELGKLAQKLGKLETAERELRQGLTLGRKVFGETDVKTAIMANNLAGVFLQEGKYVLTEQTVRPALKILTEHPLPGNVTFHVAKLYLGEALLKQGKYVESEKWLSEAHEGLKSQNQEAYVAKLRQTQQDLFAVYTALKNVAKAAQMRTELASK